MSDPTLNAILSGTARDPASRAYRTVYVVTVESHLQARSTSVALHGSATSALNAVQTLLLVLGSDLTSDDRAACERQLPDTCSWEARGHDVTLRGEVVEFDE